MSYFPGLYGSSKNKINVELYLSNYLTKSDLKSATGIDISQFAKKKNNLLTLKSVIDQLENNPVDLNKLSDVLKNDVIERFVYDELVKKKQRH